MNVTFMIGNGFDLNQKLKTSYGDFYSYYLENQPNDIISRSISNNYKLWADLELGLGQLLKDIKEDGIDAFLDSKSTLENHLENYLAKESARFRITHEQKFASEFKEKILNFWNEFNATDKNYCCNLIKQAASSVFYQFITFNYTTILDKMIATTKKSYDILANRTVGGRSVYDRLSAPLHVHGTLNEQDLILCVDNPSQIGNELFRSNKSIVDYMIKENVNRELGERKIERAREIIKESSIICLYGLSIGATDSLWWQELVKWLNASNTHRLVLYKRDVSGKNCSGAERIRRRNRARNEFMMKSGCSEEQFGDGVLDRIIVVRNSPIFTFENVTTVDENNC